MHIRSVKQEGTNARIHQLHFGFNYSLNTVVLKWIILFVIETHKLIMSGLPYNNVQRIKHFMTILTI